MGEDGESGFVDVPGGRLHYHASGQGPPLLLVHGFSLDLRMWEPQLAALGAIRRVIRYDLRGFGRSSLPEGPFAHWRDLHALVVALGLGPACDVIGLSMGGGVAIDFTLQHPEVVRALVTVDSTLGGFTWPATRERTSRISSAGRSDGVEGARALWLRSPLFAHALARPEVAPALRRILEEYSGWHWTHDSPALRVSPPAAGRLAEIRARTLVVIGEHDDADFQEVSRRLSAGIPGARLVVLAGAGHMANMEEPAAFNQAVIEFLEP
jgi:3-oxoadipate enol-lactonase